MTTLLVIGKKKNVSVNIIFNLMNLNLNQSVSLMSLSQLRTRSVQRPSQFGGSACSEELTEERPCFPSTECKLAPIDCKDDFKCDNGKYSFFNEADVFDVIWCLENDISIYICFLS